MDRAQTAPLVEARGLTKRYGDFLAVDGIDFDVWPGECLGFLGPNGAGKSSTMRMIYAASPLSTGHLLVGGIDVTRHPRDVKAIIGVVPQESNLDPDLTVRQNLLVYARYFDLPSRIARERADEALDLFQLADRASSQVETLSGGMKRRLIIARALINAPKLLVLDEPTTGLDPQARHLVWQKLRQLKAQGATMVLTTHYMEEAAQLGDRLLVLDHGHILTSGRPDELVERHVGKEVLELHTGAGDRASLLEELTHWDADVEELEDMVYVFGRSVPLPVPTSPVDRLVRRQATLEDVFLRLAGRSLKE